MSYKPSKRTEMVLNRAMEHINSVPYATDARWVFYRLVQEGSVDKKSSYTLFNKWTSRARKNFWNGWRPDTLSDQTRGARVRGSGYQSPRSWLDAQIEFLTCYLDRWKGQSNYLEVWFEAGAMFPQFDFYTNANVTLLPFRGDVSVPEKWSAAQRLRRRWDQLRIPVTVLYYGDLDRKGHEIPASAESDVRQFIADGYAEENHDTWEERYNEFIESYEFIRVGLNEEHVGLYNIPENPERPGTYQWEALVDAGASELIEVTNGYLDLDEMDRLERLEAQTSEHVRQHLEDLELPGEDDQDV